MSKKTSRKTSNEAKPKLTHINVTILNPEAEWVVSQVESPVGGLAYRGVLPLELCNHNEHLSVMDAIACASPTAVALSAVLHEIGKDALEKLGREAAEKGAENVQS